MKTTRNTSSGISCKRRWQTGKRAVIAPSGIVLFIVILFGIIGGQKSFGQGVGISETSIVPHASSILELRSSLRGFLAPRMTTAERIAIATPAQGLLVFDTTTQSFWYFETTWKTIASGTLGSGNQLLGMNAGGTANEYKTLLGTPNRISVTHAAGSITLSTPQDIHTGAAPTFAGMTVSGLTPNSGVYTNGLNALTSSPPTSGILGYWSRTGNILSPTTAGDYVTTSGNIYTTGTGTITSAGLLTGQTGATVTGATTISAGIISLNNSSNFATNINTGTSSGNVTIGNLLSSLYLPKFTSPGILHNDASGLVTSSQISLTTDITGILTVPNGGTGISDITTNNLIYGSGTNPVSLLAPGATTGSILTTTATGAPGWLTLNTLPATSGILQVPNGGTGVSTLTSHGVIVGNGTSPVNTTATGTAGQVLQSRGSGADPSYSTAIYPTTTTVNQILYSSANDNVTGLTTGSNGVLVTDAGGVPSISSLLPDAVQYNITKLGTITNGIWNGTIVDLSHGGTNTDLSGGIEVGDLLYGTATGFARLPDIATGNVLISGGAGVAPSWNKVGLTTHVSGVLQALNGGTGYDNTYTNGQLLIGNASGTLTRNPLTGTVNRITVVNGDGTITLSTPQDIHMGASPEFVGLTLSGLSPSAGVYTDASRKLTSAPPSSGTIGYWSRDDIGKILSPSNLGDHITTTGNIYTTGTGTITSAGLLTGQTGATVTGATAISDGIINLNSSSDFATNINTGTSSGNVTIGNLLSSLYLPKFTSPGILHNDASGLVTSSQISLTTDITGILTVPNGGTGISDITTNNLIYGNGTNPASLLAPGGTTGAILTTTATGAPGWLTLNTLPATSGILPIANGGTNSGTALVNNRLMISRGGQIVELFGLNDGQLIVGKNGNEPQVVTMNGDISIDNTGVTAIGAGKVLNGMLAADAITSNKILDGTIVNADINATAAIDAAKLADGSVSNTELQYINTLTSNAQTQFDNLGTQIGGINTLADGKIYLGDVTNTAQEVTVTGDITMTNTGATTISNSAVTTAKILDGTILNADIFDGTIDLTTKVTNVLPVVNGGTNSGTALNNGRVMVSRGDKIVEAGAMTNGQVIVGSTGVDPQIVTMGGDITIDNAGATTIGTGKVVNGMLAADAVTSNKILDGTIVNADINAAAAIDAAKLADGSVSNTELQYINTLTSNAQTQFDNLGTQIGGINTLADGKIYLGDVTNTAQEVTVTGDITMTNAGATTISNSAVTTAKILDGTILNADIFDGTIDLTTKVTNVLPVVNGGTNSGTALNNGRVMVSRGDKIVEAGAMTNGQVIVGSTGVDPQIVTMGGDITIDNAGATTIGTGKVVNGMLAADAVTSNKILDGTIVNADINAAAAIDAAKLADGSVSNTELQYINTLTSNAQTQFDNLGTQIGGINTLADGKIYLGDVTNTAQEVTVTGDITMTNAGATTISNSAVTTAKILDGTILNADIFDGTIDLTTKVTNVLPVVNGGTNSGTALNNGRVMVSRGDKIVEAGAMTNGQVIVGSTGIEPKIVTMSGDISIDNAGVTSIGAGKVTNSMLVNDAVTTEKILNGTILNEDLANSTIDLTSKVAGVLPGTNGGTGVDNGTKLITIGGNFTTTPANDVTLTTTGSTNVILPVAGTLVTLAGNESLSNKTINGLTPTSQANGFTISGGTIPATLTVPSDATVTGDNSGDVTLAGQNYLSLAGQIITANPVDLSGTNASGILAAARFPALAGDVITTAGSVTTTISPNAVTYAKIQNLSATSRLLGSSSTTLPVQEILLGSGLSITGSTLTAIGLGGTVTTVSVVSANGLAGTVLNPTTTPAITLSTTVTGLLKGNGTAISAAIAGSDYVVPNGAITGDTKTKITYDSKGLVTAGTDATATDIVNTAAGNISAVTVQGALNELDAEKIGLNTAIVAGTKTKISYDVNGLVTAGVDATTADINASTDRNYVTDAQQVVIGNTSGTNTGDNAANTTSNTYADSKVADVITNGVTTVAPSENAVFDALALKTDANVAIVGAQKTKITYDSKGLVTSGTDATATDIVNTAAGNISAVTVQGALNELDAEKIGLNTAIVAGTKTKISYDVNGLVTAGVDATTADINASADRNYVTDAQLIVIGNTSGTNTGDNTANTTSNIYADSKVADVITNGVTTVAPSENAVFDALALKTDANVAIVGAQKTKITYDSKGLVTSGTDATATDIVNTAAGNISAVTVQGALNELDAEKIGLNTVIVAGTKTKISYDVNGLVTAGTDATATDIVNTAAGNISAVTVQGALNELDAEKIGLNTAIVAGTKTKISYDVNGLVTAGTDATATDIVNTAAGNISAVTVQGALNELDAEKIGLNTVIVAGTKTKISYDVNGLVTAGTDATATDIVNTAAGNISAVTVQGALNELDAEKIGLNTAIVAGTKTKISYDVNGLVTAGVDATTADINASADRNYVTDAQLIVIGNTSGTNTGDNTANTTSNIYADSKVADVITNGVTTVAPSENAVFDALALKTDANVAIVGAQKTKITYDSKGLVTSGTDATATDIVNTAAGNISAVTVQGALNELDAEKIIGNAAITGSTKTKITYDTKGLVTSGTDATTADIASSTNRNYVTDAQQTVITNTSGTNTGDETNATIKTKLGAATTSVDGYLTAADWSTFNSKQGSLGFTAENSANKVISISGASTDTQYPSAKLTYDQLALKAATNQSFFLGTTSVAINRVSGALALTGISSIDGNAATATSATTAGSATNFTGVLVGDVTGTQGATVVSTVGTSTAVNVHAAELLANAATNLNTVSTIVKRDASGNFAAGTITAALSGNATTATTATNATNTGITDDLASNITVYPTWVTANTGNLPQKVTSTKLIFNPSTGMLTSTGFTGPLTGNASTATTAGSVTGIVALANGGTNTNLTASSGGIVWSNATQMQILAGTATANKMLLSGSSATPNWSAYTMPASFAGAGQIMYSSSGTAVASLAAGTVGMYLRSGGAGAPTWQKIDLSSTSEISNNLSITNGGTGASTKTAAFDALSPMTTQGDIIYGGASGTGTRLPKGTVGQELVMNAGATAPVWASPATYQIDNLNPGSINNTNPRLLQLNGPTGVKITPSKSGKILIILTGDAIMSSGTNNVYAQLYYDTAPASAFNTNPATEGFIQLGSNTVVAVNNQDRAFSLSSVLTLTINSTYYFDLAISCDANTATVSNISVSIVEL